jgi:hypothetical protein
MVGSSSRTGKVDVTECGNQKASSRIKEDKIINEERGMKR